MTNLDKLEAILRALSGATYDMGRFIYFGAGVEADTRTMAVVTIGAGICDAKHEPVPFGFVTTQIVLKGDLATMKVPTSDECITALLAVAEKAAAERVMALTNAVGAKASE